jgi:hypothetical protein
MFKKLLVLLTAAFMAFGCGAVDDSGELNGA